MSNNGHTGIIHIKNMTNAPRFAVGWECPENETPDEDIPEEDTPFETPELDVLK